MSDLLFTVLLDDFDPFPRRIASLHGFPTGLRVTRIGTFLAVDNRQHRRRASIVAFAPGLDPVKIDVSIGGSIYKGLLTMSGERRAHRPGADVPDDARM
ncbi:heat shock Hsp20-like protein [Caballeronia catudaia]|uniref:Heat shock Hsp20-like protein n=1 Tax=Caballeronia catudaia TaxID=1777136 RepID=A0A158DRF1_9BURK|nr:hypothetical protein [Caballeronia catudaia]SAK97201.1 heat shock Hsp20-like protein [Caballeronia catudaia]